MLGGVRPYVLVERSRVKRQCLKPSKKAISQIMSGIAVDQLRFIFAIFC